MRLLRRVNVVLEHLLKVLLVVSLAYMSAAVLLQVILRWVFGTTLLAMEDGVVYAFSVSVFTGAALLFRGGGHIVLSFFVERLRPQWQQAATRVADLVVLAFLIFLTVQGISFASDGMAQFSPSLGIRMGYVYAVVPFTAAASAAFLIESALNAGRRGVI